MPLFNKTFASGKMNKDMDERTVPNGEYRDALNIEVLTSNDSNQGVAQTLLGNTFISNNLVPPGSTCVGSIADNKNDKIYYLVAGPAYDNTIDWNNTGAWKDYIIEYDIKLETFKYVFVDIYQVNYKVLFDASSSDIDRIDFTAGTTSGVPRTNVRRDMIADVYDSTGAHYIDGNKKEGKTTMLSHYLSPGSGNDRFFLYSAAQDFTATPISQNSWVNFSSKRILNFHKDRYVTGINIIDGMLFWTDNNTEPKKIKIERCIAGTGGATDLPSGGVGVFEGDNANFHTRLCVTPDKHTPLAVKRRTWNESTLEGQPWFVKEENITVIRRGPLSAPILKMSRHDDDRVDGNGDQVLVHSSTDGSDYHLSGPPTTLDNSFTYQASNGYNYIKSTGAEILEVRVADPVYWVIGDTILFNQDQDDDVSASSFTEHDVRGTITSSPIPSNGDVASTGPYNIRIEAIDKEAIDEEQKTWHLRLEEKEPMFEFKFPRFAYRYKYEDGEYSTFSPWSEPAFLPGEFDYLPKKAYNLGMTNRLRSLKITNYVVEESLRPQDVVEIDLLYKNEISPNIYTVETIKMTDGWNEDDKHLWPDYINTQDSNGVALVAASQYKRGEYKVTSELIHATVPSNQLLRQWDNVPRKALAQEITSNRLVYGNYLQNYNLISNFKDGELKPKILVSLVAGEADLNATDIITDPGNPGEYNVEYTVQVNINERNEFEADGIPRPHKTARSLREYQVGVVYGDEYGRETPVLAGKGGSGTLNIPKEHSSTVNRIQAQIATDHPSWAKYFKFFVKETSNEYYNMAMDRWYNAEDGNIWLSFPSADRNKVDEESFIILKKRHDTHQPVNDPAKYKVIAINNEVPEFIKINKIKLGQCVNSTAKDHIGNTAIGFPIKDQKEIHVHQNIIGLQKVFSTQNISATDPKASNDRKSIFQLVNDGVIHLRCRTARVKSEWYKVASIRHDGTFYEFTLDETMGEDVEFASSSGSFASCVDDLRIEVAHFKVEHKKEFEGRFFVKIYKDIVLLQNLLLPKEPNYRVKLAARMGYWNIPRGKRATDDHTSKTTDWESYAVNCGANLEADCGGGQRNRGFRIDGDSWTSDNCRFFFATANNGITTGKGDTTGGCDAQNATTKWMRNSLGFFHIDACWTRGCRASDKPGCNRSLLSGSRYGKGVFNDGKSMDIGYVSTAGSAEAFDDMNSSSTGWKLEEHKEWFELMTTKGTLFKFREDPDGIVYKVTKGHRGNRSAGNWGQYGHMHTTQRYSGGDNGLGNNKIRFRVDFEALDNPEDGLGKGPSGYHILGGRRTTAVSGVQELGYWGGRRIGTNQEDLTGLDPNDPFGNLDGAADWVNEDGDAIEDIQYFLDQGFDPFTASIMAGGSDGEPSLGGGGDDSGAHAGLLNNIFHDITFGWGGDSDKVAMNVPLPPGYQNDYAACGTGNSMMDRISEIDGTIINDTTAIEQARRWRQHTAKYHHIDIVEDIGDDDGEFSSLNPAIWETEPKEDVGMDIYYEASNAIPIIIDSATNELFAPIGTVVDRDYNPLLPPNTTITGWSENIVTVSNPIGLRGGDRFIFKRPDGSQYSAIIDYAPGSGFTYPDFATGQTKFIVRGWEEASLPIADVYYNDSIHNQKYVLNWFNAYCFGNGIESDRIRDDFNQSTLTNGVIASTVLAEQYKEDHRKAGLIHSGIYNSTSNINRLNQFLTAEKITKDMNPTYGSIQKLHTRDNNIVVLHEDKCMKVLADKDALFNADGSKNVAISSNFLGSDSPFATKYGISTNPESCAVDLAGRLYFADRNRGAILRLSLDGLTAISDYGMKDWFGDNLGPLTQKILGSYDHKKEEYNITIKGLYPVGQTTINTTGTNNPNTSGNCGCINAQDDVTTQTGGDNEVSGNFENTNILITPDNIGIGDVQINNNGFYNSEVTLSFSEKAKGWVSFKSFIPESGVSINNEYYTFKEGEMYKHHSNPLHNTFYGEYTESSVTILFNDEPGSVKSFTTLNYEGSQARITKNHLDKEYYNLNEEKGWYVSDIKTNLQESDYLEFKGKEEKWYTYIKGNTTTLQNLDKREFSVQGIGSFDRMTVSGNEILPNRCLTITPSLIPSSDCDPIEGCMDPTALNYNPNAVIDDGSCEYPVDPCDINIDIDTVKYNGRNGGIYLDGIPVMAGPDRFSDGGAPGALNPVYQHESGIRRFRLDFEMWGDNVYSSMAGGGIGSSNGTGATDFNLDYGNSGVGLSRPTNSVGITITGCQFDNNNPITITPLNTTNAFDNSNVYIECVAVWQPDGPPDYGGGARYGFTGDRPGGPNNVNNDGSSTGQVLHAPAPVGQPIELSLLLTNPSVSLSNGDPFGLGVEYGEPYALNNFTFGSDKAGTYWFKVTSPLNNCEQTFSVTLDEPSIRPGDATTDLQGNLINCGGITVGHADVTDPGWNYPHGPGEAAAVVKSHVAFNAWNSCSMIWTKVSNNPLIYEQVEQFQFKVQEAGGSATGYYPTRLLEAAQNNIYGNAVGTWNPVPGYPGASQLISVTPGLFLNQDQKCRFDQFITFLNELKDNSNVPIFDPPLVAGVDSYNDVKIRISQFHSSETNYTPALVNQDWCDILVGKCIQD